jgi:RHS repeat-associated protein
MAPSSQALLCRYHYDPLDRLAGAAPTGQAQVQRFYQKSRLATEIQGAFGRTIVQYEDQVLAQQQSRVKVAAETTLLATDQQRTVLQLLDKNGTEAVVYNAYGHHSADSGLACLLGFTGEHRDPITGHYLLGNGYRAFNPVLMRFNSPDRLSPFGAGGVNAYAYCQGDPVNFYDFMGHVRFRIEPPSRVNPGGAVIRAPQRTAVRPVVSSNLAVPIASSSSSTVAQASATPVVGVVSLLPISVGPSMPVAGPSSNSFSVATTSLSPQPINTGSELAKTAIRYKTMLISRQLSNKLLDGKVFDDAYRAEITHGALVSGRDAASKLSGHYSGVYISSNRAAKQVVKYSELAEKYGRAIEKFEIDFFQKFSRSVRTAP